MLVLSVIITVLAEEMTLSVPILGKAIPLATWKLLFISKVESSADCQSATPSVMKKQSF